MPETEENGPAESSQDNPSKSALKRRMQAMQQLGETLAGLTDKQLEKIPIDHERLLQVIREVRSMRSHGARRRHLQLIGKLMRDIDPAPIEEALGAMDRQRQSEKDSFHELEKLRDDTLAAGPDGVELVLGRWPGADRQQLRQLLLQHRREIERGKPPASSRKLFRYLRELAELYGDSG